MTRARVEPTIIAVAALGVVLTATCGDTNTTPADYNLPTKEPSFFYSDHLTGASYYRFDTNGTFVLIAKEHMGVWPVDHGTWFQASNGVVTIASTEQRRGSLKQETFIPMTYKKRTFLVWPGKSYKGDAQKVCRFIDSGTNASLVYNEFLISADEFTKGTGKPYAFKFYKEMNKVTGAEEPTSTNQIQRNPR